MICGQQKLAWTLQRKQLTKLSSPNPSYICKQNLANECNQCATDCGPHNRLACMQIRAGKLFFAWLKPDFNIRALIFYLREGLSQLI